jgi:hypothetical protein
MRILWIGTASTSVVLGLIGGAAIVREEVQKGLR